MHVFHIATCAHLQKILFTPEWIISGICESMEAVRYDILDFTVT